MTLNKTPIEGVLAVSIVSNRQFPRHCHDEFGIGVISQGGQRSWSGRGPVESLPGDVITVNAGEVHDGLPKNGAARQWHMLYFDASAFETATKDLGIGYFEFQHPSLTDAQIRSLFSAAYAAAGKGKTGLLAFESAVLELMAFVGKASLPSIAKLASPNIRRARDAIDASPAEIFTLAELAELAGMSRFPFLRAFAKETGITPHAYLVQRRVRLARSLIANGATLSDAAHGAGFADQSHMTRAFLRQYGFTPGVFAAAR